VRFSAVGAGALGSQLLVNLARVSLRPRLVADADHLLPHNLARHALFDSAVGETKASALAIALNSSLDEPPTVNGLVIDVLDPRRADRAEVFRDVDTVLDLSASVAVSRHLSVYSDRDARRIAIFLSSTGNDLVVLAEDRERTVPLDALEMNYYWDVATNESLAGHFGAPGAIRYGVSCRDVSSFIPQSIVAVHAGNAARTLSRIFHENHASSFLWSLDAETGTVSRTNLGTSPMRLSAVGEWTVAISERLVEDLACERMRHVPRETGGLLIGRFDHLYKRVYVVGYLPAPPDSISWPTRFIRGVQGIKAERDNVTARTANALEYVGEWHSHPEFTSSAPSHTDEDLYRWLDELLRPTGKPPVMLIIGSDGPRCVMALSETPAVP
jgi:integrative and conjugative element protein (TIGR02256 family)